MPKRSSVLFPVWEKSGQKKGLERVPVIKERLPMP